MNQRLTYFALLLVAMLLGNIRPALAQDEQTDNPDMDMLEFLGEWEVEDGSWVDPFDLQAAMQSLPQGAAKNEEKDDESR